MPAISLQTLLSRLPPDWATSSRPLLGPDVSEGIIVTGVAEDSRRVGAGSLFIARRGRGSDGYRYIPAALAAGAVGVVCDLPIGALPSSFPESIPCWQVSDGRATFALLSAAFYDFPTRELLTIGVTGTDGKTTTSTLIHSILTASGRQAGLITSISALIGDETLDTGFHVTTPEAFDLQGYLARMRDSACTAAVIETTSHGLDQMRVGSVEYDVAVVTNVTHEHLDWHGSWDGYMAAKARLFEALANSARKPSIQKMAVLNRDDRSYAVLRDMSADTTLTYSLAQQNAADEVTCSARDVAVTREGTRFLLQTPNGATAVQLHLLGRYNVANALAAACVGLGLGIPLSTISAGLGTVERIRGRMEWVYADDFDVVVDFAHTPNALRETLDLARELVRPGGRVIPVFGSAGLRDVAKRRLMGEVASAADFAVITAEDPRTEDVNAIITEIAAGLEARGRREGTDFISIPDRAEAIATAIRVARAGDLIVTCGKAHEQSMCYGTIETPWDEFAAVRAGLAARSV